ncbi:MAG: hypothetical protein PHC29_05095 [Candidatus Omnitrophica bacterium]|nr:hypothetical protein [Candidatus Omnitrophota bacterium]
MKNLIWLFSLVILVSGCANPYYRPWASDTSPYRPEDAEFIPNSAENIRAKLAREHAKWKEEIDRYFKEHPERLAFKDEVINKKIRIGMAKEEVLLSWGKPGDINRTVTQYSTHEQWVYSKQYLYFENGILTTWQD